MTKENEKVKDSVFTDLFQNCSEAVPNSLSLFNALNGTDYSDLSKLKHIKVSDTIYLNFKNDVSFQYDDKVVVLVEHQSSINGNMPLRALMYIGRLYEKLVPTRLRYKRELIGLPIPEIYVLYNGKDDTEREYTLRLSDAFGAEGGESPLELVVKVINIRLDKEHPILERCKVLQDYSKFIETIEKYKDSQIEEPYMEAIKECIDNDILRDYLIREGSEVVNLLIAEYDYNTDIEVQREEAFGQGEAKGRAEGIAEGKAEGIAEGKAKGKAEERNLLNSLTKLLIRDNRYDDLKKAIEDAEYQDELIKEYGIIE